MSFAELVTGSGSGGPGWEEEQDTEKERRAQTAEEKRRIPGHQKTLSAESIQEEKEGEGEDGT